MSPRPLDQTPLLAQSQALRQAHDQLSDIAPTDLTVLLLGETGTGKGLAAHSLHRQSRRGEEPFIQVNCGAMPEGLVENELFGHEKGAFTGAHARRLGKVELAQNGTLFLDEIGDMSPGTQVKLLRLLEERTFERVGGTQTLTADARIVAATNRDLEEMVAQERFREDLYFRLQVFPIHLPPLRDCPDDIPLLAVHFMEQMAHRLDKRLDGIAPDALAVLRSHAWPGNIRELEHVIQRATIVCQGLRIRPEDLHLETDLSPQPPPAESPPEFLTLEEYERRYILEVLDHTDWVVRGPRGAAAILGLHESTLRSRMRKLGIKRPPDL